MPFPTSGSGFPCTSAPLIARFLLSGTYGIPTKTQNYASLSRIHLLQFTQRCQPPSQRRWNATATATGTIKSPPRGKGQAKQPLPLSGVTVVTLEHAIAAPFCTRHLADLGARVIKVERPGEGDLARGYDVRVRGLASHFVWVNRSKESLALNLKDPKHFEVLKALVAKADVLVQNLAPGATERLGLSYDALKDKHPSLIVCDVSGYGPNGPYSNKKAYDLLIQSESGLLSVTGTEAEPSKVGVSIADIAAGTYAHQNILAALISRSKNGNKGTHIEISMLESMAEWMSFPLYYAFEGAQPPKRTGATHASIYPYGPFPTGGNGSVMLGIQNEREWAILSAKVLDDPDLAKDERFSSNTARSQNREALGQIIRSTFSKLQVDEVLARLDNAGIANAKVNDMQGLWEHPQLRARDRWTTVQTPAGDIPAMLPPGAAHAGAVRMDPVPGIGEHNDAILMELGFEDVLKG